MRRITRGELESVCSLINSITGSPNESWKRVDGKSVAQAGNYHIDEAYGGVALHRMVSEGGGVETVIGGYRPKRELLELMQAYISGLRARK